MTREGIIGWGSHNNDMRLHQNTGGVKAPGGWTFPTQTDDAVTAAAAFGGTRWIRADNTSVTEVDFGTLDAVTPKDYQWPCIHPFRLSGTLGAADQDRFIRFVGALGGVSYLEWDYVTASTFKVLLTATGARTLRGTSSTTFSVDTNLDIRIQRDGAVFRMWVGVDGGALALEMEVSPWLGYVESESCLLYAPTSATQEHYWGFGIICQSDDIADRPNTAVEMQERQGASDWATEQEYGDDVDCSAGSTDATYTDVNLDGSDEITEPTPGWCEDAGEAGKQMSEMADLASGFTGTILGIFHHAAGNNSGGAGKTVATNARIHDGTAADEKANANLSAATPVNRQHWWADPPGAANWEAVIKTASSTLRAGVSSDAGNNDLDGWTGMVVEVYAVGNDPPVTDRRRVLAQVA